MSSGKILTCFLVEKLLRFWDRTLLCKGLLESPIGREQVILKRVKDRVEVANVFDMPWLIPRCATAQSLITKHHSLKQSYQLFPVLLNKNEGPHVDNEYWRASLCVRQAAINSLGWNLLCLYHHQAEEELCRVLPRWGRWSTCSMSTLQNLPGIASPIFLAMYKSPPVKLVAPSQKACGWWETYRNLAIIHHYFCHFTS